MVVAVSYGGVMVSHILSRKTVAFWIVLERVQNLDRSALLRLAPTLARLTVEEIDRILCQAFRSLMTDAPRAVQNTS